MCVNVNGSYDCTCGFGYSLMSDGETCESTYNCVFVGSISLLHDFSIVSTGVIVGGTLGVLTLTVVLIVLLYFCFKCLSSHWRHQIAKYIFDTSNLNLATTFSPIVIDLTSCLNPLRRIPLHMSRVMFV